MTFENIEKNYTKELEFIIRKLGFEHPLVLKYAYFMQGMLINIKQHENLYYLYDEKYFKDFHKEVEKYLQTIVEEEN